MVDNEELLDGVLCLDEMLSEAEEALEEKKYSVALHKIKEARDIISEMRDDDEALDDRQEIDMHVAKRL
jgi:flagellin-specific chaperone FliS